MKFAHAVPMHAIQVLAVLAWLLSRSGLPQRRQTRLVALAVVGYGGLFGVALWRTSSGLGPVEPLDASTLGYLLAAGLVAASAVAAVAAATIAVHPPPRTNPMGMEPPATVPGGGARHRQRRRADPNTDRLEEATMDNDDAKRRWRSGETALGGLLVLLGILVLAGQAVDVEVGEVGWPFFVIVPGLGLLGLGLATDGRLGEVLAMVGGVVSVNWAGVGGPERHRPVRHLGLCLDAGVPGRAGIGRWLVGVVRGRRELAASGGWLIARRAGRVPGVGGGLRGGGRDRRPRLWGRLAATGWRCC